MDTKSFYFKDFKNSHIAEIFQEIYIDKVYDEYLTNKTNLTIIDIGANIGLTAHYFKDYGIVYAVEPARDNIECLEKMIENNRYESIKIFPYAISHKTGPTSFYHNDNRTMSGLDPRLSRNKPSEIVMALTMDLMLDTLQIKKADLVKFDVEGEESNIILSDSFKSSVSRMPLIIGEWHSWTTLTKDDFKKRYEELGYEFKWHDKTQASVYIAKLKI